MKYMNSASVGGADSTKKDLEKKLAEYIEWENKQSATTDKII